MNELMIDCLIADSISSLEHKNITKEQFDNRIKKLEKMKEELQREENE
jgi:hypothetical protein